MTALDACVLLPEIANCAVRRFGSWLAATAGASIHAAGAAALIVEALEEHSKDATVVGSGCLSIVRLAEGSDGHQLMRAGAAARIVAALEAHLEDTFVAAMGCWTIANLAEASEALREQLMRAGAAAGIVAALQKHAENAAVWHLGSVALPRNLGIEL